MSFLPHSYHMQTFDTSKRLKNFWSDKMREVETMSQDKLRLATRTQELPLARVKKVMKIDEQVKDQMISVDVPILMAKACEMLCERLTLAAWKVTEDGKRKTLVKSDIAEAVAADEKMDFLVDIVPRPERHTDSESAETTMIANHLGNAKSVEIFPAHMIDGRVYVEQEPGLFQVLQVAEDSGAVVPPSNH